MNADRLNNTARNNNSYASNRFRRTLRNTLLAAVLAVAGRANFCSAAADFPASDRKESPTVAARESWKIGDWCEAAVIIVTDEAMGSGAIVSGDGWILTNYHVVESQVQHAALTGETAIVQVLRCRNDRGRMRPQMPALEATVYRVARMRDLALLKIEAGEALPFFPLAQGVELGEDCFAIGSQGSSVAWGVKRGNIAGLIDFPQQTSVEIAVNAYRGNPNGGNGNGGGAAMLALERPQAPVVYTTCAIAHGDSGGPLLNARGELIALNFAGPGNETDGATGFHIHVDAIREFLATLPTHPELAPLDLLTAGGKSEWARVPAMLGDLASPDAEAFIFGDHEIIAATLAFIDLNGDGLETENGLQSGEGMLSPAGVWPHADAGEFHASLAILARADGVMVIALSNERGVISEMRIDLDHDGSRDTVWTLDAIGEWHVDANRSGEATLDESELSKSQWKSVFATLGSLPSLGDSF